MASFLGVVMAQQAYPTLPVANTIWTSPSNVTVQWKLGTPPATTALAVELFKGDPSHQTLVQKLGTGKPGATSLKVAIPAKLESNWYSVRIGDSYSHPFIIKGTGPVPTGPAPTGGNSTTPTATGGNNNSSATATGIKSTNTPTGAPSSASYTSASPVFAVAAAVAAVVMTL
ncbi:hypothetical protein KVV02_000632 [Mortierella alpina]|uniref:Uncharacterized protein n=1 Tax=Mortierella alpina TaxID=64518 RepID=A0A9P8A763_MORAP|nr:hypothetical protein KVV02_000632 [Mortierella alpina]